VPHAWLHTVNRDAACARVQGSVGYKQAVFII